MSVLIASQPQRTARKPTFRPTEPSPAGGATRHRGAVPVIAALTAAVVLSVHGSVPLRTAQRERMECSVSAMRNAHTFPHDYVGEVFLQVGTKSSTAVPTSTVLAWGPYRWPEKRTFTIPPASKGGLTLLFTKRAGTEEPNYEVVFRSDQDLCFRWGTTAELPHASQWPARFWVKGNDIV